MPKKQKLSQKTSKTDTPKNDLQVAHSSKVNTTGKPNKITKKSASQQIKKVCIENYSFVINKHNHKIIFFFLISFRMTMILLKVIIQLQNEIWIMRWTLALMNQCPRNRS